MGKRQQIKEFRLKGLTYMTSDYFLHALPKLLNIQFIGALTCGL